MDTRVDNRISAGIKQKASKALADPALPKYRDIPNVKTMKLEGTMSYPELEKRLDE